MATTVKTVVTAMITSVSADAAEHRATIDARSAFVASAVECSKGLATKGVTATAIKDAVRAAIKADQSLDGILTYTSDTAIGFHALTGDVLQLDGALPDDVDPRTVQTLIKKAGVRNVRKAIADLTDLASAYAAIVKAAKTASKPKTTNSGNSDTPPPAAPPAEETTQAGLLRSAQDLIAKAATMGDLDDESSALVAGIQAILAVYAASEAAPEAPVKRARKSRALKVA